MTALLDVNVLLALLDPLHIHHDRAQDWFGKYDGRWASCPITQNGYVRIASQPRYSNPFPTTAAILLLKEFTERPDHEFWPDSISLLEKGVLAEEGNISARRVTDVYLLRLAVANRGQLATFDLKLSTETVVNGNRHILILP